MKEAIRRDLHARYQTAAVQKLMNVATFIDPRYRELPFLSHISKRTVKDQVEDELLSMESTEPMEPEAPQEDEEPPAKKAKKGPVSKLLGDLFEQRIQSPSFSDKVTKGLELYKAEQPAELDSNPLAWWKTQTSLYPLMRRFVQKIFSFVATSVPSERLFSISGNVITEA